MINNGVSEVVSSVRSMDWPVHLQAHPANTTLFSTTTERDTVPGFVFHHSPHNSFTYYIYLYNLNSTWFLFNCPSGLQIPYTHPFTRLTALCPGLPGWAGTRKVKPIWILLKQKTVSGSEIRWAIYKSAPCSRQITTSAPHRSVFYRPDALPAAQPTASKHWRQIPYIF